jgi:hypothetical protein
MRRVYYTIIPETEIRILSPKIKEVKVGGVSSRENLEGRHEVSVDEWMITDTLLLQ